MRAQNTSPTTRRSALAGVLVLLSLIAHAAAAGSLPSGPAILGAAVVAGAIAWSLAGQRRSVPALVAVLFAGQLLVHAVVVALGHHGVSYLPDLQMTTAHLVAAGVAAVMFARAEQIAAAWARAAARLLGVGELPALAIASPVALIVDRQRSVADSVDMNVASWRGPPAAPGALTFA